MISDSTLSIILTALPPTIVALAGLIVSIINSIKSNQIHVLVNSNYNKAQEALATALAKVEELKDAAKPAPATSGENNQSVELNVSAGVSHEDSPGSQNS